MRMEPLELYRRAADQVKAAGIDNVVIEQDQLVMCGIRYVVEPCTCGDLSCDGVRLRRAAGELGFQ